MLVLISTLTGILTALVIRYTTNARALRDTRRKIYAHLLEFRLFFDEPALIWRAQLSLLRDNLRLLRLLLLPTLILALPMAWLFEQLDALYGHRPLRPGEATVATLQLSRPIATGDRFELRADADVAVETPPVRVFHENQVSWRIRPASGARGALQLTVNGRTVHETLARSHWLPYRPAGEFGRFDIEFPPAGASWMFWFLAMSLIAAMLSARLVHARQP